MEFIPVSLFLILAPVSSLSRFQAPDLRHFPDRIYINLMFSTFPYVVFYFPQTVLSEIFFSKFFSKFFFSIRKFRINKTSDQISQRQLYSSGITVVKLSLDKRIIFFTPGDEFPRNTLLNTFYKIIRKPDSSL